MNLDFIERAIEAENFDEDVIKELKIVINNYKIYQQIIECLGIDSEWQDADGKSIRPLFEKLL